jgi:hypothetical protein
VPTDTIPCFISSHLRYTPQRIYDDGHDVILLPCQTESSSSSESSTTQIALFFQQAASRAITGIWIIDFEAFLFSVWEVPIWRTRRVHHAAPVGYGTSDPTGAIYKRGSVWQNQHNKFMFKLIRKTLFPPN